jgi:hypothetical protein
VVLVDERDWAASLAAASLAADPLGAPLLYSEGETLPAVSREALEALHPRGAASAGGAQVIRVATSAAVPGGYHTLALPGGEAAAVAAAIERIVSAARGAAPQQVIVTAADGPPALAMGAAGLSAESGAPILFVTAAGVPAATAAVLSSLGRPTIYAVGPSISARALAALAQFGRVVPIAVAAPAERDSPAANAIAVSRFADGSFGWGVHEAGHGLVFALASDPLDAPAAAPLSAHGDYAPLLLLESPTAIPAPLSTYLGDIQPGYSASAPPVRGFYNHGWLIGSSISAVVQAEIDSLLEISPSKTAGKATVEEEPSSPAPE